MGTESMRECFTRVVTEEIDANPRLALVLADISLAVSPMSPPRNG